MKFYLIFILLSFKYEAALIMDGLSFFSKKINTIIGQDSNRLFGMTNVSLRKSEIYVNKTKGISCNYDFSNKNKWPIGNVVLEQLKKDSHVFFTNIIFFST